MALLISSRLISMLRTGRKFTSIRGAFMQRSFLHDGSYERGDQMDMQKQKQATMDPFLPKQPKQNSVSPFGRFSLLTYSHIK